MTRRPRRNHSAVFKAKVALAAIKGEKTMVELAQEFDLHANQIKQWKDQLLEGASGVFAEERTEDAALCTSEKLLLRPPPSSFTKILRVRRSVMSRRVVSADTFVSFAHFDDVSLPSKHQGAG